MKPLSITWVALVGFVCTAMSFLGFFAHMRAGNTPMIVTPGPAVLFAVATACLIWSGLAVRRLRADRETWIDALGAMRVAVFARTSALVGSALTGFLGGVMAVSLTQLGAPAMASNAIASGLSALVGLVWVIVALVVERWCIITDDDGPSSNKPSAAA
ncbi:hypothetical protein ADJ76_06455 [Schaalia meyeri]|uniref:DUF3180 domain-containing protein n=1 Tax=Schaalia meyeri TaxID=52773 RepID=A0AAP9Y854_9ACTO|nr:DUF3180 family protein [Schaalia meyeri]AKU65435.1 hypothetical protein ADJ76_06455 [Schaalia meyeri]QQC43866.1 DUF3180 domain-containing protein [Schaalia meyeri]SDR75640.1 Protein of unknown function [Schaalia meyeri]